MKAITAAILVSFLFAVARAELKCNEKCQSLKGAQNVACQGACQFCELQKFNTNTQDCSECESNCNQRYPDSMLESSCLKGCKYSKAEQSNKPVSLFGELKSGAEWALKKSQEFLTSFFEDNKNAASHNKPVIEPKKTEPVTKPKSGEVQNLPADEHETVWITRLRIFFIGPTENQEDHDQENLISNKMLFSAPAIGHDDRKPFMNAGDVDRQIMVKQWNYRRATLRPLLLLGAISSLGLAILSLAALCLLIRNARRRREALATSGNIIYADLPKYDDDISLEKAAHLAAEDLTTTDDKAPLTV